MAFQISLQPGGQRFSAEPGQTLLDAALAAGLLPPHGCRNGACGACKGKVLSGEVDPGAPASATPGDAERAVGATLLCRAMALSDLELEVHGVTRAGDMPVKKLPCRVHRLERAAEDVILLDLRLPASETFQFRAGQYIDFLLADGARRSFSIANAPHDPGHLELHIRRIPGGRFTTQVFETMKERDILRFEGPLGSFSLREDGSAPIVLLAGGTGFAPIKAIVEHAAHLGITRPMTLYWGARDRAGLYMDALAREWERTLSAFRYVPVLSADTHPGWQGRCGLAHHAVMEDLPDLSAHEVYACGAPAMIDAARKDFIEHCGLPEDAFLADSFTFSNP